MSTPQIVETSTPDVAAGNKITMVSINDGAGLASRQVVSIGDPTTGGQFAAVTAAGKLLVTPDSVALPANQSVNAAQFGGTNVVTGTGLGGAGIPRVTVSSDS